ITDTMPKFSLLFPVVYIVVCFTSVNARPQERQQVRPIDATTNSMALLRKTFGRLPGVCRHLKRRRITIMCNTGSYCPVLRNSQHGHVCSCAKGSRCTHFFLKSF
uniref:Cocaine- and amphetamine-regulated transcript protein n=1 Tax=Electrophorus electricus TaxID=8005 RepID=A0A4W4FZD2_ELEEL